MGKVTHKGFTPHFEPGSSTGRVCPQARVPPRPPSTVWQVRPQVIRDAQVRFVNNQHSHTSEEKPASWKRDHDLYKRRLSCKISTVNIFSGWETMAHAEKRQGVETRSCKGKIVFTVKEFTRWAEQQERHSSRVNQWTGISSQERLWEHSTEQGKTERKLRY